MTDQPTNPPQDAVPIDLDAIAAANPRCHACGHAESQHRGHAHRVGTTEPLHCRMGCACFRYVPEAPRLGDLFRALAEALRLRDRVRELEEKNAKLVDEVLEWQGDRPWR